MTKRQIQKRTAAIRKRVEEAEKDGDGLTIWRYFQDLADRFDELAAASSQIVNDWDSVDENAPVPDEINVNTHWNYLRSALRPIKPGKS